QELRLASQSAGPLNWLAGFYYFDEVHDQDRDFSNDECSVCVFPPVFSTDNVVLEQTRFDRDGWAAFGQVTYSPVDALDLSVGARYSREKITATQSGTVFVPAVGPEDTFAGVNSETFSNFSPQASLSYRWNDEVMTYITVSRGYKAGGYDKYPGTGAAVGIPFDEETSTNYEAGFKASMLDRRLTVDGAVFHVDISDMQLGSTVISPITNLPVGVTTNVGKARSRGAELEVAAMPAEGLMLRGNGAYVDTTFRRLDSPVGVNEVGGQVPYVPKWTLSGSAEYSHALPVMDGGWEMTWGVFYRYVGSHETGNGIAPFDSRLAIDSYDVVDASVSVANDNWDLTVFVNNLTDSFNVTRRYNPAFQPFNRAEVLPPRQFGARLSYSW
ncbi:MAG: TonB-dependent receptor, partial [Sphingomonadales bacterium]